MAQKKNPTVLIKKLATLREEIKRKTKEADLLKAERDTIEQDLISLLEHDEMLRVSIKGHTATLTQRVVPTVTDWDAFYKFMKEKNALFMLERRPSPTAYREMLEARDGAAVPGVESFTKKTISLRSTS